MLSDSEIQTILNTLPVGGPATVIEGVEVRRVSTSTWQTTYGTGTARVVALQISTHATGTASPHPAWNELFPTPGTSRARSRLYSREELAEEEEFQRTAKKYGTAQAQHL